VFPKGLFEEPRPSTLITVPACQPHNRLFSLDEEYFRDFALASSYSHPEGRRLWEKTRRTLRRKPAYRAMLAAQLRRMELRTGRGVFLGWLDALVADPARIERVLRKMTRGLYWHEYSEPLGPVSLTVHQVRPGSRTPDIVASIAHGLPPAAHVGHVAYRFGRDPATPGTVAAFVTFFGKVGFVLIALPSEHDDRLDLPRGRRRWRGLWLPPDA
jgi:hypothetical protein